MSRDDDLLKKICQHVGGMKVPAIAASDLEIEGYSQQTIVEHCRLLWDQGLLKATEGSATRGELQDLTIKGLTAKGQRLLQG